MDDAINESIVNSFINFEMIIVLLLLVLVADDAKGVKRSENRFI